MLSDEFSCARDSIIFQVISFCIGQISHQQHKGLFLHCWYKTICINTSKNGNKAQYPYKGIKGCIKVGGGGVGGSGLHIWV